MEYIVNGRKYVLDYQGLRDKHIELCRMGDEEFMKVLPEALHLACVIGYLKGLGVEALVSDEWIIHELVHLLDIHDEPLVDLEGIRYRFKILLQLA